MQPFSRRQYVDVHFILLFIIRGYSGGEESYLLECKARPRTAGLKSSSAAPSPNWFQAPAAVQRRLRRKKTSVTSCRLCVRQEVVRRTVPHYKSAHTQTHTRLFSAHQLKASMQFLPSVSFVVRK